MHTQKKAFVDQLIDKQQSLQTMRNESLNKLCKPIREETSDYALLNQLTKTELDSIRRRVNIKHASQLNKDALIQTILDHSKDIVEHFLNTIDNERLTILQSFIQSNGYLKETDLKVEKIKALQTFGIAYMRMQDDEAYLVMPKCVLDHLSNTVTKEMQEIADRNDAIIRTAHGLTFYYGCIEESTLIQLIGPIAKGNTTLVKQILDHAMDYYDLMNKHHTLIIDSRVVDADQLLNVQHQSAYDTYHHFSDADLIEAGTEDFMPMTDELMALVKHMTRHHQLNDSTLNMVMDGVIICLNSFTTPDTAFQYLSHYIAYSSEKDAQKLYQLLIDAQNSMHIWSLKGHKRLDEQIPNNTKQIKVKRNDPCPCGSGKKFKKCCASA
ncbi:SEC-C motif-containing protein [Pelagirhabdus alkalitolerans]|uniref:SEC-C motif-containing protein n=1 Tax=Pelagirhabdus alkalitolerans TaxID=1612202 RepID=A0A1G6H5Z6_9BACI|nr:SEC-C domain-containing protein [Pelagirhabdus alkalitolerans]SDB89573.1 SEC-C motif-containing protein [Pelagirhabdus alkalitolerans]